MNHGAICPDPPPPTHRVCESSSLPPNRPTNNVPPTSFFRASCIRPLLAPHVLMCFEMVALDSTKNKARVVGFECVIRARALVYICNNHAPESGALTRDPFKIQIHTIDKKMTLAETGAWGLAHSQDKVWSLATFLPCGVRAGSRKSRSRLDRNAPGRGTSPPAKWLAIDRIDHERTMASSTPQPHSNHLGPCVSLWLSRDSSRPPQSDWGS